MKLCDKSNKRTTFPEVKPGDVVKTSTGLFYLVFSAPNGSSKMVNLESGDIFALSLWGTLQPHQVEVVENACLVVK